MAIGTELAVQSIELEQWVDEIADLQQHFDKLQTRLEKGGKKKQISNQTERGTTQRNPFWVPIRTQGGAGNVQQFAADTASTVGLPRRDRAVRELRALVRGQRNRRHQLADVR